MRRHLNISLESVSLNTSHVLSLEEEQMVMSDAADLANDVNQELNEVDRIIEVSDALEDLAVVADQIEEASPTDIALIETAGDMAVAGTDIEAEEIVPSLESFKGMKINTESLKNIAATIWKNIQAFLTKVWENIEAFFYKIFGAIPTMRRRLEEIKAKLEKTQSKTARATHIHYRGEQGSNASLVRLTIGGMAPRSDVDFINEVKRITEMTKFVYGANIMNRNALGNAIADAISGFNPEGDLEEQAAKIGNAYKTFHLKQVIPGKGKSGTSNNFTLHQTDDLLGGGRLVGKVFESEDKSTLGTLDRMRHSGIVFDNVGSRPTSISMPILSLTSISSMISEIEHIFTLVEDYKRGAASKQVKATKSKLEAASKKASAQYNNKDASPVTIQYFKAMVNFNASYARWVNDPAIPFARYVIGETNALMNYLRICLSEYA